MGRRPTEKGQTRPQAEEAPEGREKDVRGRQRGCEAAYEKEGKQ